ncbi:hypothetical protein CBR_g2786 [Chara braunii]|uniref:aminodeoxychorismate synthase n=1 Tax=Chara braunii TaxID=69332 RepID=A0A388KDV5_CHABU|nr:hypothetical protein CBR_g2786 [Chara braunii]|eukprot:GBG68235.1 hypothetical protein CBR_g2786 [Chara braunii]
MVISTNGLLGCKLDLICCGLPSQGLIWPGLPSKPRCRSPVDEQWIAIDSRTCSFSELESSGILCRSRTDERTTKASRNSSFGKWIAPENRFLFGAIEARRTEVARVTGTQHSPLCVCCGYDGYHNTCSRGHTLQTADDGADGGPRGAQQQPSRALYLPTLPSYAEGEGAQEGEARTPVAGERDIGEVLQQPVRTLLIDNYDSYTYNLYQMLGALNGEAPLVVRNDEITSKELRKLVDQHRFDNIVISPGPGTPSRPSDIGICSTILEELEDMPILGVCLGHQALGFVHGASVVRAPEPVHGRLSELEHVEHHPLFRGIPSGPGSEFKVVRYHSLVIDESTLPDDLLATAWTVSSSSKSAFSSSAGTRGDGGKGMIVNDSLSSERKSLAGKHCELDGRTEGKVLPTYDRDAGRSNGECSQSLRDLPTGNASCYDHYLSDDPPSRSECDGRCLPGRWENGSGNAPRRDDAMDVQTLQGQDCPPRLDDACKSRGVGIGTVLDSGRILMAVSHKTRPHHGVQFHPESISTAYGNTILRNFHDLTVEFWQNRLGVEGWVERARGGSNGRNANLSTKFMSRCVPPSSSTARGNAPVLDSRERRPERSSLGNGKDLPGGRASDITSVLKRNKHHIPLPLQEGVDLQTAENEDTSNFTESRGAVKDGVGRPNAERLGKNQREAVDPKQPDPAGQGTQVALESKRERKSTVSDDPSNSPQNFVVATPSAQPRDFWDHILSHNNGNSGAHPSPKVSLCSGTDYTDTDQTSQATSSPVVAHLAGACRLVWAKASNVLERAGGSEAIFMELFGRTSGKDAFWLDSAITCERRARFSFMGGPGGPMWRQITYSLPDPHGSDARGVLTVSDSLGRSQQCLCSQGLLHQLEQALEALKLLHKEDADGLPFSFVGGFVGYLGYEMKAECGALSGSNPSETPDAAFFLADRFVAIDHRDGDVYAVCLYTDQEHENRRESGNGKPQYDQATGMGTPAELQQATTSISNRGSTSIPPLQSNGCDRLQSAVTSNGRVGDEVDTEQGEEGLSSARSSGCACSQEVGSNPLTSGEGHVGRDEKRSSPLVHISRSQEVTSDGRGQRDGDPKEMEENGSLSLKAAAPDRSARKTTSTGFIGEEAAMGEKEGKLSSSTKESALVWVEETLRRIEQLAAAQVEGNRRMPFHDKQMREEVSDTPAMNGVSNDAQGRAVVAQDLPGQNCKLSESFRAVKSQESYVEDVKHCLEAIYSGESYEVCLTTSLISDRAPANPLSFYRILREKNPAPYAAWLNFSSDSLSICCSSPERFLRLDKDRTLEAKPIKGTVPRGTNEAEDELRKQTLMCSEKDSAENLMIVDLLRNDLGRVCDLGSVHVPIFMDVETYATVHQLVSTIRGKVRSEIAPMDCVRAAFPGGSMTGAPKLRTIQILDAIEGRARGVYSGSIGFFSINGTFDLNIVIRTAVVHNNRMSIGAGGAVVALSDSHNEYMEMLLKTRAILMALDAYNMMSVDPSKGGGNGQCDRETETKPTQSQHRNQPRNL